MRVKSDPFIPNSTQAIERQSAKAREDKWMLEVERAMLASKPPQALAPAGDEASPDPLGTGSDILRSESVRTIGGKVAARADQDDAVASAAVQAVGPAPAQNLMSVADEASPDAPPGIGAVAAESAGQAASVRQPGMLFMHGAAAMRIDAAPSTTQAPPSTTQAPASVTAPAPAALAAQPGVAATPISSGALPARQTDGQPGTVRALSAQDASAALSPGGGSTAMAPNAVQPDGASPLVDMAQPISIGTQAAADAVTMAFRNPVDAPTAISMPASGVMAAIASYAALNVGTIDPVPTGVAVAPQAATREEPAQEESAVARQGAPEQPDAEPYGLRNLHLAETAEGMHAWVRDASLAPQQGASVAQALMAQFVVQGTPVGSVTVNGRLYASAASTDADEKENDGLFAEASQAASGSSDINYIEGAA